MLHVKQAILTLEDGTVFEGKSFGSEKPATGEVVFHTAMTGYPENLSDPSFTGQILVSTYPMIGNYGVPFENNNRGFQNFFSSRKLHISGLVISDYSFEFSHWSAEKSLSEWLKEYNIPGIFDVDTRALTKILRDKGSMSGKIEFGDETIDFLHPDQENLVKRVSCLEREVYGDGDYRVVLVDCGVKTNTIPCLLNRGATVIRVPWDYDFSSEDFDGVFISNGPGNPELCDATIQNIKKVLNGNRPIMGVCIGNLLLARASGAETFKLKSGHRSQNQPVLMKGTNRCFITSQNHSYAVVPESLPADWEVLFTNANDSTIEGIRHKTKPFFGAQFCPEVNCGPGDTQFLIDDFFQKIKEFRTMKND
ncbi:MAG: glutamine-hydrolyzing carbamoyl-phosphate synthase small subunit [Mariniphaga sp.]|jgi:carbamoyl-phosphate synthase small subunit|nr:glutamine-hydrolyzing carbamoyl-phosphate synthase small subunit [Mariniphaga sp.]